MTGGMLGRIRGAPGGALLLLALLLATLLYAPTLGRGLVNHDDPWLVANNWIVKDASSSSLRSIWLDLDRDTRLVLGAEYLPVRDLSIMLDAAVWGDAYAGFHLTNLVLYLGAIALWYFALAELGIDRTVCGIAILLWAVHPSHVESVAWLSERKGLLAIAIAGVVALGYARYRAGGRFGWLVLAAIAAPCAVWSKALALFSIASLAGLELALPARRVSWRRSLGALAAIGALAAAAFVPVLLVARNMSVVSGDGPGPGEHGWLAMVLGVHGFYVRLAAMAVDNSISYPITTDGPQLLDIVVGTGALAAILALLALRRGGWLPSPVLRGAAVIWIAGWFPASRILLPVRLVVAADRYLMFASMGAMLAVAVALVALSRRGRRSLSIMLGVAIVFAASARTLVAQAGWRDDRSLWARAVTSNPRDAAAWNMYAESLAAAGDTDGAEAAVDAGLARTHSPRLELRRALVLMNRGDRAGAREWLQRAADGGEAIAMTNLALVLEEAGELDSALAWSRKAVESAPLYTIGHRNHGRIARATGHQDEALAAFRRAYELEPTSCTNRYNLALGLSLLGNVTDARPLLEACANDPVLGARVRFELEKLPR